ncbi:MAG TPA: hypothetical protein VKU19_28370 [Bryobacteraceae bacterium]|nr:hypothetical protein [Bryobacteraceae bacterium]
MRNDPSRDELKNTWQNQATEIPTMTLKLIQSKARGLRAKTRKQLLGTLAGPAATAAFYVMGIREFPTLETTPQLLFGFACGWSLAGLYFLNRGMWSAAMPGDAGLSTGLEFCRQELERRRRLLSRILIWSFGPVLLAIATFILALAMMGTTGRGILPNGLPFLVLVAVWIVSYFAIRLRDQRELKHEIDELSDIAAESGR